MSRFAELRQNALDRITTIDAALGAKPNETRKMFDETNESIDAPFKMPAVPLLQHRPTIYSDTQLMIRSETQALDCFDTQMMMDETLPLSDDADLMESIMMDSPPSYEYIEEAVTIRPSTSQEAMSTQDMLGSLISLNDSRSVAQKLTLLNLKPEHLKTSK